MIYLHSKAVFLKLGGPIMSFNKYPFSLLVSREFVITAVYRTTEQVERLLVSSET